MTLRAPLAVAALALVARIAFIAGGAHDPFVSLRTVDEVSHLELAHRFAAGDVFFGKEVLWFPPAYPVLLGCIEKAFGQVDPIVPLAQHALGIATAVLAVLAGRRLGSPLAGTIAGGLLGVLPTLVHAESRIHYTALLVFASAAFLLVFAGALRAPDRARPGVAGLWLGFAGLFRANVLAFLPFGAAMIGRQGGASATAQFLVGALVTLLPVTVRNGVIAGSWTPLTSNGGMILATAFASDAAGGRALQRTPQDFGPGGAFQREAERNAGRTLTLSEASRWHGSQAIDRVLSSPGWALSLTMQKLRILASAEEIDDHPGFTIARERTGTLGWLPAPWAWVALPAAAGAGIALRGRDEAARGFRVPLAFLAVSAATLLVFFVTSRYRLPLLVPASLLAGLGVERFARSVAARDARGAGLVLAACGIAAFPVLGDPGVRADPAMNWVSIAGGLSNRGDHALALQASDEALRQNHALAGAWQNRAVALAGLGQDQAALQSTEEALRIEPDLAPAWNTQGALLARAGQIDEALERFRRAAELAPESPDILSNLARALAAQEDLAGAVGVGRRAISFGATDLEPDVARWEAHLREATPPHPSLEVR